MGPSPNPNSIILCQSQIAQQGEGEGVSKVKGCYLPHLLSARGARDSVPKGPRSIARPRRGWPPGGQGSRGKVFPAFRGYHKCACARPYTLPIPRHDRKPQ